MEKLIDQVAAATAECGMQTMANWFPASRHAELREFLNDLTVGALAAYRDAERGRDLPEPSPN